jgi:hypothetical protein
MDASSFTFFTSSQFSPLITLFLFTVRLALIFCFYSRTQPRKCAAPSFRRRAPMRREKPIAWPKRPTTTPRKGVLFVTSQLRTSRPACLQLVELLRGRGPNAASTHPLMSGRTTGALASLEGGDCGQSSSPVSGPRRWAQLSLSLLFFCLVFFFLCFLFPSPPPPPPFSSTRPRRALALQR